MKGQNANPFPWQLCFSEFVGTALLVWIGLSLVILMFGTGSPIIGIVPSEGLRRLITGFLFGTTGALIALSPVGKESGAHINPVVTLGFWLMHKLNTRTALGYVIAQLAGAGAGALPLLAWGSMGRSVVFGATLPGEGYSFGAALMGEAVTTFSLISGLCVFLAFRTLRPFTPAIFPFLYAVMVYVESPISGTSTNPARSLGPAIISGAWDGWWIYWVGPLIGTLAAILVCSFLAKRIEVAKLYYFDTNPDQLLHRESLPQRTSLTAKSTKMRTP
ncbi:MAG TPA: aquaporin [Candidatus Saccharimonadales bacterium]|nr:aquaporin [Candidatus Saccharimonadales bacterium]